MTAQPHEHPPRVRLTALSHGGGCACKLGSADLTQVLRHIAPVLDPRVLVDASTRDDAAIFRLSDDRALVATVDFFTPIVDEPADWGAVAAANALSDVYAMGGTPLFALNLVGWPRETVPFEMLGEVLRGAGEVARRANCLVLGGHSIDDPEPKFGMVVIGEVHPNLILTNAGAQVGDLIVLTKPIGTGILATALKRDALLPAGIAPAVASMTVLNDGAMRAALRVGVDACTDVTGFGLLGHFGQMLTASGVAGELAFDRVPILPHASNLASRGLVPGGTKRNLEAAAGAAWDPSLTEPERVLLADAQTSGGLLLAVPAEQHAELIAALRAENTPVAATVGRVVPGAPGALRVARSLDLPGQQG